MCAHAHTLTHIHTRTHLLAHTHVRTTFISRILYIFLALQVESEFEALYNKYVKDKSFQPSDHRSMLMCCLSVATYRILNDEIEDTKLVSVPLYGVLYRPALEAPSCLPQDFEVSNRNELAAFPRVAPC